ncbi:MAG TPA: hypothetical protein VH257_15525, partial [Chloroflexota bacterium]|nr:hypothetical protein [Chloroflexota bacterium]
MPFWTFPAVLLLGLLVAGAVLFWTWQRDRTQDAAVAEANRAAATAQAQQDAQATASVTARGAAATATVSAIQTAIPGVPEFTVERVELPGSPLYDELRAAERRYWETYADALYDLDSSRLSEVAAGEQLEYMVSVVEALKAQSNALDMRVGLSSYIFNVRESEALIRADQTLRIKTLNAETKQPISQTENPTPQREQYVYVLSRVGSGWKVVDSYMIA